MSPISEIDAIKTIDDALSGLQDPVARDRVLQWAWDKFSSKQKPEALTNDKQQVVGRSKQAKKTKTTKKRKTASKSKFTPSIVKELNLNPSGKKSFKSFIEDKKPETNDEKCTVIVYYLRHILEIETVSLNHIFTCYKNASGWRIPADLRDTVLHTAHGKGWLNTSDTNNITTTPQGENLVEFDLPKVSKAK